MVHCLSILHKEHVWNGGYPKSLSDFREIVHVDLYQNNWRGVGCLQFFHLFDQQRYQLSAGTAPVSVEIDAVRLVLG